MKKLIVFLAIFTFLGNQNNDENISAEYNKKGEDISYPLSPVLEMKYDTFKWKDGKNYIFLNVSLDYSYRSRMPSVSGSALPLPVSSSWPTRRYHTISLIRSLNRGGLVLTVSGKRHFYNALAIKPTVSDSFIEQMKKRADDPNDRNRIGEHNLKAVEDCLMKDDKFQDSCWPVLQLNGLFLVDDLKSFDEDDKVTITLTIFYELNPRRHSGYFSFKKVDIDREKIIEPFNPEKFDPSIPKATRAWYQQWVHEQKD